MEVFYKKGKGNAGLDGVQFQVNLLTVFLLNALRSLKGWRISTENAAAGKFDDVVIEFSDGSAVLLQAKQKDNKRINRDQLLSVNFKTADFSLPKYFLSYQEIKSKFAVRKIIICTNADMDKDKLKDILDVQNAAPDSILHYEGENCSFVIFNENISPKLTKNSETYCNNNLEDKSISKLISQENIKDFLGKLQLFTCYPSGDNLHKIIDQLLSRLTKSKLWSGISSQEINKKVEEWFKFGQGEYLTETRAIAMFCEIKTEKYCKTLNSYEVFFERDISNFTESKRIFHVTIKASTLLPAIKIFHSLQDQGNKILFIDAGDDIQVLKQAVEAFRICKYKFLVLIWHKITHLGGLKEIGDSLKDLLDIYKDKKVVLIAQNSKNLIQESATEETVLELEGSVTFQDLKEDCRGRLLRKKSIIFQDAFVSLTELMDGTALQDYSNAVDEEILEKLVIGGIIKVGTELSGLNEITTGYYVERTFEREENQQQNANMEKRKEIFTEKSLLDVKEKVILISDSAGTGKTTVLAKLAVDIKEKSPNLWVIRLELINYSRFLKNCVSKNKTDINITEFLNAYKATKITNALEKFVFSIKEKVVIMLDGFDEICPDYMQLILKLLGHCQKAENLAKVIVTTRPHVCQELEALLQARAFVLQPLTEEQKMALFKNCRTHTLDDARLCGNRAISVNTLQSWLTQIPIFIAVPLHVRMLAEIFEDIFRTNSSEDEEKERMTRTKLYEMFTKKKLDVFIDKANPIGTSAGNYSVRSQYDYYFINHQSLAVEVFLKEADKKLRDLFSRYQYDENMETNMLQIGIVEEVDGKLDFLHATFAEYFMSKSIVEISGLDDGSFNRDIVFQQFFIDEILCNPQFTIIRLVIDDVLEKVAESLPADIFQSYQLFATSDQSSLQYRSGLIHLLATEGCVSILRLVLKCINFTVITDKEFTIPQPYDEGENNNTLDLLQRVVEQGGINIKDEHGQTPLHYAVRGQLDMTKFLVEQGADINAKDVEGWTVLHSAADSSNYHAMGFILDSLDVVRYIVEPNNANFKMDSGDTTLDVASLMGPLETIRFLVDQGADVNARNKEGNTALYQAVQRGHLDVVQFLVGRGADINLLNNNGLTVLDLATQNAHLDVIKFLET